jgi:hypothetical protein
MQPPEPAILSPGTKIVTVVDLHGEHGGVRVPRGAVGSILKSRCVVSNWSCWPATKIVN